MNKLTILLITLLLFTGCLNQENNIEEENQNNPEQENIPEEKPVIDETIFKDGLQFKNDYESYNDDYSEINFENDIYVDYLTTEETIDLITNKTGILYFGRPTCPHCRTVVPTLIEVANESGYGINYLNTSEITSEEKNQLINLLSNYLESSNGQKAIYVPHVFFIKDGQIVKDKLGGDSTNDLITIFNDGIDKLKN